MILDPLCSSCAEVAVAMWHNRRLHSYTYIYIYMASMGIAPAGTPALRPP
jgi:hypothetical protein